MIKMKTILHLTVIVFLVITLTALNAAGAGKVLKIGILAPYTGPAAKAGGEFKGSAEMALEKIGYKIGDYKIEVVWIDSQSDPAKAASAYSEAAERGGIQAGVLNWHSSVAIACMDIAAQYKIPHFFAIGSTELVNKKYHSDPEKYSYWGGKFWSTPDKLVTGYVDSLNDAIKKGLWKPEKKLIAIYGEETDWGRSFGGALKKEFMKSGWKISSEDYFPLTQTDFYPLMNKYKKAGVAAIAGVNSGTASISAFIKQSAEVKLKALIIADGLGWSGEWYKLTGKASNGVLDMIPQLTTPQSRKWAESFKAKYGYSPSPSAGGLNYDAMNFFIKVARRTLEKYGKLNKETLHKIQNEELATGKLTFTAADGALIMKSYRYTKETMPDPVVGKDAYYFPVLQYKNGKGNIIYPDDWKQAELTFK